MNGEPATKFILPGLASLGGLAVGVVSMIAFLYGQFYTLREHEEFRKTMTEAHDRLEDRLKRDEQTITEGQRAIGEMQGFIAAHKAGR